MEFRVLGPLEITIDGDRLRLVDSREQRVLAMLLLEAGRVVPLTRLVAAAWDKDPPPSATKLVRNSVSVLRRRLADAGAAGQLIVTDPAGYALHVPPERIDLAIFEYGVAQGRHLASTGRRESAVTCLRGALALWRGDPLAGVRGAVIQAAAARLAEHRLTVQEECLAHELALGRGPQLVAELTELVAVHPLRERLHAQLMLAMHRAGRRGEALGVYRLARRTLVEELGLEPGPELTALHQAILSGDSRLDAAVAPMLPEPAAPRHLPAPPQMFIRRIMELDRQVG